MEPPKKVKVFSMAELSKHNLETDCWLAVRGKVYDVTKWISRHPGGVDMITLNAGRDATQLFESYHPMRAFATLEKYYIGELSDTEFPTFPPMSPFYITLKKKIEDHFAKKNIDPRYSPEMLMRIVLLICLFTTGYILSLGASSPSQALLYAGATGFLQALVAFTAVHEGSHASTTRSPFVWRLLGAVHDFVLGASFYNWLHQHFLGHHPFTNVTDDQHEDADAVDPDVCTNDPDIRRIKPTQKWYNHYQWQAVYAPILYGLLLTKARIFDFVIIYVTKKSGPIKLNPINSWHLWTFWGGKAFFVFTRLVLPFAIYGFWRGLLTLFISDFVASWTMACIFQANHIVSQAVWPKVDKTTNSVHMDWAEMQIRTTVDYGHESPLTVFFTGGLNYQITHHLFPFVCQVYYPEIAPIIKQHCKQYGIPYHHLPNFYQAFKGHLHYLSKMGAHYDF